MGRSLAAWFLVTFAAASPATAPRDVVQIALTRVVAVLESQPDFDRGTHVDFAEKRRVEIRKIAADLFDYQEMSRRALSRHWAAHTPSQHTEFVGLFTDLLERSYVGRIEAFTGEKISIIGQSVDANYATVRSRITGKRRETTLDYRLYLDDGRWRVYDIVIDGVSFVSTYRNEFDRVIRASSYATLVERMKQKQLAVDALPRQAAER